MSLWELQRRFRQARGKSTRDQVVEAATRVPGAPDSLTTDRYQHLETALQHPPRAGAELRAIAAALGIPMLDVLRDLDYWPPLPGAGAAEVQTSCMALVEEACRLAGWRVQRTPQGDRLVIQL
jgi:hypothetical protein